MTPATDVYSAGIVLYEMLAGRAPFGGESAVEIALQHVQMQPPPLPRGTPRPLEQVIERALAKDPADRYQSALAMADALAEARARAGEAANPEATRATAHPRARTGPDEQDDPLWAGDRERRRRSSPATLAGCAPAGSTRPAERRG